MSIAFALYANDELRAMTKNHRSRDSAVIMSSVVPSLKCSCSGSPPIFRKGKNCNGWFVRERSGASRELCPQPDPKDPNGPCNILELLVTNILVRKVNTSIDLLEDFARHTDAARFRNALDASCHVYSVPIDACLVENHLSDVDPDTELHSALGINARIALGHLGLDGHGTLDCIHHTSELGEYSVPSRVDDAAAELANHWQDDRLMPLEFAHCAQLVCRLSAECQLPTHAPQQNKAWDPVHHHLPGDSHLSLKLEVPGHYGI